MEITKTKQVVPGSTSPAESICVARAPSVCCSPSDLGYLLALAVVPGPLWRGLIQNPSQLGVAEI